MCHDHLEVFGPSSENHENSFCTLTQPELNINRVAYYLSGPVSKIKSGSVWWQECIRSFHSGKGIGIRYCYWRPSLTWNIGVRIFGVPRGNREIFSISWASSVGTLVTISTSKMKFKYTFETFHQLTSTETILCLVLKNKYVNTVIRPFTRICLWKPL